MCLTESEYKTITDQHKHANIHLEWFQGKSSILIALKQGKFRDCLSVVMSPLK